MQLPDASKRHERIQRIEVVPAHDLHAGPECLQRIQQGEVEGESLVVDVFVPRPMEEVALDCGAQVGKMRHEVEGGGGAEQQRRLEQVLVKTVTAASKRRRAMTPNAVGDVDVPAE